MKESCRLGILRFENGYGRKISSYVLTGEEHCTVPSEDIQAKCPMRAVQVIPEDLLDDQEIQRLLESISKIKKKYARTNSTHSMDTSKEHNEQKNGNKSTCYSASVIILTIVFVVLLFVTILVVCSSLPYVNPHTRKVDASSEALEAEETLAVIVLMCLWCCLAFVLHLVCKYSRSSDKTNDCSSRMEP